MADGNVTIIKKKKVDGGHGHHGGAWKVAYADFVTAMMAFFLLMWLLNATTEKQRKGIADHFSPTIPLHQTSAGGNGPMSGATVFAENDLSQNGQSGTGNRNKEGDAEAGKEKSDGSDDADPGKESFDEVIVETDVKDEFEMLEDMFMGSSGESDQEDSDLQNIRTRVTDEGLVIELFDRDGAPLFDGLGDAPTPLLTTLLNAISGVAKRVQNPIAINGHAFVPDDLGGDQLSWSLSSNRAFAVMNVLVGAGMDGQRVARVTGHGRRKVEFKDVTDRRNNRIEIVLLR